MSTTLPEARAVEIQVSARCPNLACEESGKEPLHVLVHATVHDERYVSYMIPVIRCFRCRQFCYCDGYNIGGKPNARDAEL